MDFGINQNYIQVLTAASPWKLLVRKMKGRWVDGVGAVLGKLFSISGPFSFCFLVCKMRTELHPPKIVIRLSKISRKVANIVFGV